jgi:class 3 adenylate cyclase
VVPELPSGTVTFVFTDIEESTELLKRLGDAYTEVLSGHRRIVRDAFTSANGIEMDTQGDAFFFVFSRARDGLRAAVEAQRSHAAATWPENATVRVRIGLHTGEPAIHEEGYVGLDVVRAARICTVGRGGQILLSETTRALLGSGLPDGVSVFPLGQRHLRGIDEPERVYEVAIDDLEPVGPLAAAPAAATEPAEPPVPVPPGPPESLERDIGRRFEDMGARLSDAIQQQVLRKLEDKLGRSDAPERTSAESASGVDDIATRMQALGDEIDARIKAALAKRGVPSDDS